MMTLRAINPSLNTPFQPRFAGTVDTNVSMTWQYLGPNHLEPSAYDRLRRKVQQVVEAGHGELAKLATGDTNVSFKLHTGKLPYLEVVASDVKTAQKTMPSTETEAGVRVEDAKGSTSTARIDLFNILGHTPPELVVKHAGGKLWLPGPALSVDHLKSVVGQLVGRVDAMKTQGPDDVKAPFALIA